MQILKKCIPILLSILLICSIIFINAFHGMPVSAASGDVSVSSCVINPADTAKVTVSAKVPAGLKTDDGKLYLFAVPAYVDSISGKSPVTSAAYTGAGTVKMHTQLKKDTSGSLLYSKFYVAVKSGGTYQAVTNGSYITNPEAIARSNKARAETDSKKGVHIDFYLPTDMEELDIQHSYLNICYEDIISNTKTEYAYTYNGKKYYFNPIIKDYDTLIRNMTNDGISVNVALVNQYRSGYEYMIHPGVSQTGGAVNYAVNTSTQKGLETLAAATHFLAHRYNGANAKYGKVENWIFGNEANDNGQYYYMGAKSMNAFVEEYLQSFRIVYNAVKSAYANANVYICLQHRWNTPNSKTDYAGKAFLTAFNQYAKAQGNIDWGLAYHPYSFPMNDPDILNDGKAIKDENGKMLDGGEVTNDKNTPIITMKNLQILTEYFHDAALLNPDGEVRSIILSEQGYTSKSNVTGTSQARQAANIALAYYIAEMNDDIDAFILRCTTDEDEGSPYYKFGLRYAESNGYPAGEKLAYSIYQHLDSPDSTEVSAFALSLLNIDQWSDVVRGWDAAKFDAMGDREETRLYSVTDAADPSVITTGLLNEWNTGYNVFDFSKWDYVGTQYDFGLAVADPNAYYRCYQGVETTLKTPADLTDKPYLTMDVHFTPKNAADKTDKLEVKVRVHGNGDEYDAVGVVDVNRDYKLCVDLTNWDSRRSIDRIEVLIREYNQKKSFDGTYSIYNVSGSASVAGQKALPAAAAERPDLSSAVLQYKKEHKYTGKAISPELTVTMQGKTLKKGTDYELFYHDNVKVGTGHIAVVGIGKYSGSIVGDFRIYDPNTYQPDNSAESIPMHRLYNPNSGEHFYTGSILERDNLIEAGWKYEGIAWNAPTKSGDPVYRLYNPNSGDHHYTMSAEERDMLVGVGWIYEGVAWNSAPSDSEFSMKLHRLYNPNADCGSHHYTGSEEERDMLVKAGWIYEGIGWFGLLK